VSGFRFQVSREVIGGGDYNLNLNA